MKRFFGFMLMPLLACGLTFAQSSMSSDTDKDKHDHVEGKTKTMTGCVEQRDGKYWLADKKHHDVELMGTEDMSAHVGHKMSVTGTMSKMDDQMAPGTTKADKDRATSEDPDKTTHDDSAKSKHERKEMDKHGMRMMNVSSMQMVSDKCELK